MAPGHLTENGSSNGLERDPMKKFLGIAKALSDENRVRILMFLREGEMCVCQIIEMLRLAPSTVSEHMAVLHRAGLVTGRKEGRWMFYSIVEKDVPAPVSGALEWLQVSLAEDRQVSEDAIQLRAVKHTPVSDLCKCYKT